MALSAKSDELGWEQEKSSVLLIRGFSSCWDKLQASQKLNREMLEMRSSFQTSLAEWKTPQIPG